MPYTSQAAFASNANFRDQIRVALMQAALTIMGEQQNPMTDATYGKRQQLAWQVITSAASGQLLDIFVWSAAADASIGQSSTDAEVLAKVNALWNDIAGVRITDG